MYGGEYGACGPNLRDRVRADGLISVADLDDDTETHFRNLRFTDLLANFKWKECELIENRIGRTLDPTEKICELHRNKLGIGWKQPTTCLHPAHPPLIRGKKGPATRLVPLPMVNYLNERQPFSFVVGGRMCTKHRKIEDTKK